MFLMSLHNCNPYGAVQCGPNQAVSMTLCCQQNLTRDVCAHLCRQGAILVDSFPSGRSGMCMRLLSKQRVVYLPACIILSLDYRKQKLMGVAALCMCVCACVCIEVKAARPLSETPMGATLGPSRGQIRGH